MILFMPLLSYKGCGGDTWGMGNHHLLIECCCCHFVQKLLLRLLLQHFQFYFHSFLNDIREMVAMSIAHLIQNLLLKLLHQRSLSEIQDY